MKTVNKHIKILVHYKIKISFTDVSVSCKCHSNCDHRNCKCRSNGELCTTLCHCSDCKNPLSILNKLGVPIGEAKTDCCLMDNIALVSIIVFSLLTYSLSIGFLKKKMVVVILLQLIKLIYLSVIFL